MGQHDGKRAVITGGTSGIGYATAKLLIAQGGRALVTGRAKTALALARKELGKDAIVIESDAASLADIDALADRVKSEFGTLDLLFVNAGQTSFVPFDSMTEAVYDQLLAVNAPVQTGGRRLNRLPGLRVRNFPCQVSAIFVFEAGLVARSIGDYFSGGALRLGRDRPVALRQDGVPDRARQQPDRRRAAAGAAPPPPKGASCGRGSSRSRTTPCRASPTRSIWRASAGPTAAGRNRPAASRSCG